MKTRLPSGFWKRVLEFVVPEQDRSFILDELQELYDVRVNRDGKPSADRWFRGEVVAFIRVPTARRTKVSRRARRIGLMHWLGEVWIDIVRACRSLRKNPGFASVALITMTIGIGANAVIFTVVDHVALRPLPYDRPHELVAVWPRMTMLRGEVDVLQKRSRTLHDVAYYAAVDGFNLQTAEGSRRIQGNMVSPSLLGTLGILPFLGRNFRSEESQRGADGVVLISFDFWRSEFGADSSIVGRTITLDDRQRVIVGVLPPRFGFPSDDQDVLVPVVMDPSNAGEFWGYGGFRSVARIQDGTTVSAATTETRALSREMRLANTLWTPREDFRDDAQVLPLQDWVVEEVESTLWILAGAVVLVLFVTCANVSNLMLARGLARGRDTSLRSALGASRGRLIREHLAESLTITFIGTIVAFVAAEFALKAVVAQLPPEVPGADTIALDWRIVLLGTLLALVVGLVTGLLPSLRGSRANPAHALRESGRGTVASRARRRLSSALVVLQVGVAVILVVNAGLLVRSLSAINQVNPGFEPTGATVARLTLSGAQYDNAPARLAFYEQVLEAVGALPEVSSAGIARKVPFGRGGGAVATFFDGVTEDPNDLPVLEHVQIVPGYLEALGVQLIAGRMLTPSDGPDAPLVTLVDAVAAERFWPGESPIGRRLRYPWRGAPWIEVVGVVSNVADDDLTAEREPTYYVPMAQNTTTDATLLVRATVEDAQLGPLLRAAVHSVDQRVPVSSVLPMHVLIAETTARTRWTAGLLGGFAAMTLLLGCVGIYGIVAYSVRSRKQEFGLRMALGANASRIGSAVLHDGLRLIVPGAILGVIIAIPAARVLKGMLFGVSAFDPVTFTIVPLVFLAAGVFAIYMPLRRAVSVDPLEALRE